MKKSQLTASLGTIVLTASLVACAGSETPVAMKTVNPQLEDGVQLTSLPGSSQALSSTLLEAVTKQGVPQALANSGFAKYDHFVSRVKNRKYLSLIDFTQFSGHPRFYMINLNSGQVDALLVAHGAGSDPANTGTPTKFSNVPNSKMSSLGAYLVSETSPSSAHGTIARLDGLESSNSLARPRAIILHSASYVSTSLNKMGRSWGCPAISLEWIGRALQRLPGGSFMYAFGPAHTTAVNARVLQQMMLDPAYQWVNEFEDAPVDGE